MDYWQKINNSKFMGNNNESLFSDRILEKNIFDQDISSTDNLKEKNKAEYNGKQQRFDRIEFYLNLEYDKIKQALEESKKADRDDDVDKYVNTSEVKDKIIKIFKEEKMDITNILQKELREQVYILNKEIVYIYLIFLGRI